MSISEKSNQMIHDSNNYGAHNYHPIDVVIQRGEMEWLWDVDGRKFLDMLSAYSAVSHGHCHPKIRKALLDQSEKLTLASRAFYTDQMALWLKKITKLCDMEMAIPMNTGAEAVETAIKIARKWGYTSKNISKDKAEIIVCHNNFHGRTTTVVGFSSELQYKELFGPYSPGFTSVPFGDLESLKKAITPNTVGFLFEPIQGEGGVILPPEGFLGKASQLCRQENVLMICDEIQTGLGRTGKLFAYQYEDMKPDLLILGKALGGGFYPISAVLGSKETVGVLQPGDHGSTFGGNPLACAVSIAALDILVDENLTQRSHQLGEKFRQSLQSLPRSVVKEVRGRGLMNAIEIHSSAGSGRFYTELLMKKGVLAKETKKDVVRFAPPLVIDDTSLEFGIQVIQEVFAKTQNEYK